MEDFRAIWVNELQVKEAQLSTRGKRIIVPGGDHMIPFERPDAIVAAIREVLCSRERRKYSQRSEPSRPGSR
jgi:pimeloyl-ACP methyl ester carboxylesterase